MSGIIAIYGPDAENEKELAEEMLSRIRHRGPSFANIFSDTGVILGFVGKGTPSESSGLPYRDKNGSQAVTCDAEIYNADTLLSASQTDASFEANSARAIVNAYKQDGETFVRNLDGQFSFVLFDNGDLVAARDPLGVIPLYTAERDGLKLFSSELKCLSGLASNIQEFPPGRLFHSRSGFRRYCSLEPEISENQSVDSLCAQLRELLEVAVRKRLECCDKKKGVFLSGGVDSSVIAAVVSKFLPGVDSFTVGMENGEDVPNARLVAKHLGTNSHVHIFEIAEVLEVLPKVLYHLESFDAPLVRSATANYIASGMASQVVDTILIGEGGDENFGGYHHVKRFKSPEEQQKEFINLMLALHNMGFMRTDRMNWAHSLNVRAPFFDSAVVNLAMSIHPKLKLYGDEQIEKWILRKAFEDYLPEEVVWRPKKQFARGSGSDDLLTRHAESEISDSDFDNGKRRYPDIEFRWKEEWWYFTIFRERFGDDPSTLSTVGRWYE